LSDSSDRTLSFAAQQTTEHCIGAGELVGEADEVVVINVVDVLVLELVLEEDGTKVEVVVDVDVLVLEAVLELVPEADETTVVVVVDVDGTAELEEDETRAVVVVVVFWAEASEKNAANAAMTSDLTMFSEVLDLEFVESFGIAIEG